MVTPTSMPGIHSTDPTRAVKRRRRGKKKRQPNPLGRGRPHPNDYHFPKSFPSTHVRGRNYDTIVYALAMSWHRPRDRIRLQMLKNRNPRTHIITVSDCEHSQGSMEHISSHFDTRLGRRVLRESICGQRQAYPRATINVFLDYFFLQAGYYHKRYGMQWLSATCPTLLEAGADEVILPYDGGWSNAPSGSNMESMLAGPVHPKCTIRFISLQECALWAASDQDEIATEINADNAGDNSFQTAKFLHPERPFVSVQLAT